MSTTSHLEMHREHLRWRAQNDMWRDDLANWEREAQAALKALPKVEEILRKHLDGLRRHAAAIRINEQEFSAQEHALSEYERGDTGQELIELAKRFDRSNETITHQKEKHEKIKHRHYRLMTRWNRHLGLTHMQTEHTPHHFII
jgi:hypothetical protein